MPVSLPDHLKPLRWQGRRLATVRRSGLRLGACLLLFCLLSGCVDHAHQIVVSVPEQKMLVVKNGVPLSIYPVSTSRFGLGDEPGRCGTPLGQLEIGDKIGGGLPAGAVLKSRVPTGEVLAPNAPGRDPVVTRILWLRGLESRNRNAEARYIYIHGTPEESNIGKPASYGCVRMRSADIIALFDEVGTGARVFVEDEPLATAAARLLTAGTTIPSPMASVSQPPVTRDSHNEESTHR